MTRGTERRRRRAGPSRLLPAFLFLLFSAAGARPVAAQTAWRKAVAQVDGEIRAYLDVAKSGNPDAIRQSIANIDAALEAALVPEIERPDRVERLAALLQYAERFGPEAHPGLYNAFERRTNALVTSLDAPSLATLKKKLESLWSARNAAEAAKKVVQRMLFATSLPLLVRADASHGDGVEIVRELFEREIEWLPRASREVPLKRAVRELGEADESRTIYPILDAVQAVYEATLTRHTAQKSYEVLEPFVLLILDALDRVEVRVSETKDAPPDADGRARVAQTRLWFELSTLLREWTGETGYDHAEDWKRFASIYFGPKRAQVFDFPAVRERKLSRPGTGEQGTKVVRNEATFFGIEARTSRFLIIVDVSGSMRENPQNVDRLTALQDETVRFIRDLPIGIHYNILPFSSGSEIGRSVSGGHELVAKTLPRGEIDEKTEKWIRNLQSEGTTRVDLAFEAAFGAESIDPSKPTTGAFQPEFDEIYFITDGSPTDPSGSVLRGPQVDELLEKIHGWNARHRVKIHALGFQGMSTHFIDRLAKENGGTLRMIRAE